MLSFAPAWNLYLIRGTYPDGRIVLRGPDLAGRVRLDRFRLQGWLHLDYDVESRAVTWDFRELHAAYLGKNWLVRGGVFRRTVDYPFPEDWGNGHTARFVAESPLNGWFSPTGASYVGAEFHWRAKPEIQVQAGLYYDPFDHFYDLVLPRLALSAAWRPAPLFTAKLFLNTFQYGRVNTSPSPFADRRTYSGAMELGVWHASILAGFTAKFLDDTNAIASAFQAVQLDWPLPLGFQATARAGLIASGGYEPSQVNDFVDLSLSWRREPWKIFIEDHLAITGWSGFASDHQLLIGVQAAFSFRTPEAATVSGKAQPASVSNAVEP